MRSSSSCHASTQHAPIHLRTHIPPGDKHTHRRPEHALERPLPPCYPLAHPSCHRFSRTAPLAQGINIVPHSDHPQDARPGFRCALDCRRNTSIRVRAHTPPARRGPRQPRRPAGQDRPPLPRPEPWSELEREGGGGQRGVAEGGMGLGREGVQDAETPRESEDEGNDARREAHDAREGREPGAPARFRQRPRAWAVAEAGRGGGGSHIHARSPYVFAHWLARVRANWPQIYSCGISLRSQPASRPFGRSRRTAYSSPAPFHPPCVIAMSVFRPSSRPCTASEASRG